MNDQYNFEFSIKAAEKKRRKEDSTHIQQIEIIDNRKFTSGTWTIKPNWWNTFSKNGGKHSKCFNLLSNIYLANLDGIADRSKLVQNCYRWRSEIYLYTITNMLLASSNAWNIRIWSRQQFFTYWKENNISIIKKQNQRTDRYDRLRWISFTLFRKSVCCCFNSVYIISLWII